jgi:hypothetical protein
LSYQSYKEGHGGGSEFISSFKMIHVYMMSTNFSPLDEIIDKLGGPGCVSEMTGRRGRIVRRSQTDKPQYEQRSADVDAYGGLDSLNVQEVKKDIISYYLVEDAIYIYVHTMYIYCFYPAMSKTRKTTLSYCLKSAETSIVLIIFDGILYDDHDYNVTISYMNWSTKKKSMLFDCPNRTSAR